MSRQLINPESLHPTPGFSHIAIAEGRRLVFFAGQTALDRNFGLIGEGDLRRQALAAMRNLEVAMHEAGCGWDDIVRRTIYTTCPQEFAVIAEAINEATGGAADPPQTIAGVSGLALPGLLIEIEATAVIG